MTTKELLFDLTNILAAFALGLWVIWQVFG